jgi:hypothetical protein
MRHRRSWTVGAGIVLLASALLAFPLFSKTAVVEAPGLDSGAAAAAGFGWSETITTYSLLVPGLLAVGGVALVTIGLRRANMPN